MAKVLIIDDNRFLQRSITRLLGTEGHDVDVAGDGLEGLEKVIDGNYDVILVDYNMPNMDGYGFCELIKADPYLKRTPLIGIGDFPDNMQEHLECCMPKPWSYLDIHQEIKRVTSEDSYKGEQT